MEARRSKPLSFTYKSINYDKMVAHDRSVQLKCQWHGASLGLEYKDVVCGENCLVIVVALSINLSYQVFAIIINDTHVSKHILQHHICYFEWYKILQNNKTYKAPSKKQSFFGKFYKIVKVARPLVIHQNIIEC